MKGYGDKIKIKLTFWFFVTYFHIRFISVRVEKRRKKVLIYLQSNIVLNKLVY